MLSRGYFCETVCLSCNKTDAFSWGGGYCFPSYGGESKNIIACPEKMFLCVFQYASVSSMLHFVFFKQI